MQEKALLSLTTLCNAEKESMSKDVVAAAGSRRHSMMLAPRRSQYGPPRERPGLLKRKDSIINKMRFREQVRTPAHAAASFKRLAQPKTAKTSTKRKKKQSDRPQSALPLRQHRSDWVAPTVAIASA